MNVYVYIHIYIYIYTHIYISHQHNIHAMHTRMYVSKRTNAHLQIGGSVCHKRHEWRDGAGVGYGFLRVLIVDSQVVQGPGSVALHLFGVHANGTEQVRTTSWSWSQVFFGVKSGESIACETWAALEQVCDVLPLECERTRAW
jgi:hypothetical protein